MACCEWLRHRWFGCFVCAHLWTGRDALWRRVLALAKEMVAALVVVLATTGLA